MTELQNWLSNHLNKSIDYITHGNSFGERRILTYYLNYQNGHILIQDYDQDHELSFPIMEPVGNENSDINHLWKKMNSIIENVKQELVREGWEIKIYTRNPHSTTMGEIWCICSQLHNTTDQQGLKKKCCIIL